jgi:hypothetical protein
MTSTQTAFWTAARIDLLLAARRSGKSLTQIAAAIGHGCNRSMVAGKLKRLGEFTGSGRGGHARRVAIDPAMRQTVIRMANSGAAHSAIAAALGIHKKTAGKLVKRVFDDMQSPVPRPPSAFRKKKTSFGWRPKAPAHPDRLRAAPKPMTGLSAIERAWFTDDLVPGLAVTLMEARNHHCRWPRGAGAHFRFCGAPADLDAGRPYCARHDAAAHGRIFADPSRTALADGSDDSAPEFSEAAE